MSDLLSQSVRTLEDLIPRTRVGIWRTKNIFFHENGNLTLLFELGLQFARIEKVLPSKLLKNTINKSQNDTSIHTKGRDKSTIFCPTVNVNLSISYRKNQSHT